MPFIRLHSLFALTLCRPHPNSERTSSTTRPFSRFAKAILSSLKCRPHISQKWSTTRSFWIGWLCARVVSKSSFGLCPNFQVKFLKFESFAIIFSRKTILFMKGSSKCIILQKLIFWKIGLWIEYLFG